MSKRMLAFGVHGTAGNMSFHLTGQVTTEGTFLGGMQQALEDAVFTMMEDRKKQTGTYPCPLTINAVVVFDTTLLEDEG